MKLQLSLCNFFVCSFFSKEKTQIPRRESFLGAKVLIPKPFSFLFLFLSAWYVVCECYACVHSTAPTPSFLFSLFPNKTKSKKKGRPTQNWRDRPKDEGAPIPKTGNPQRKPSLPYLFVSFIYFTPSKATSTISFLHTVKTH